MPRRKPKGLTFCPMGLLEFNFNLSGSLHNVVSHPSTNCAKAFERSTFTDINGFESEFFNRKTKVFFGITNGGFDGFGKGKTGGFGGKFEMSQSIFGGKMTHRGSNEAKLAGAGTNIFLSRLHK